MAQITNIRKDGDCEIPISQDSKIDDRISGLELPNQEDKEVDGRTNGGLTRPHEAYLILLEFSDYVDIRWSER